MKIGSFAKEFNTTPANVRYYIDLGLLIPDRNGSQYDFDEKCRDDMLFIKKMKGFGFCLKEVNTLLSIKRMTKFKDHETNNTFMDMLEEKKGQIRSHISELEQKVSMIDQSIMEVSNIRNSNKRTGVSLSFLDLLACPDCGRSLSFNNANIEKNQIISGTLQCSCGYSAVIEDGILVLSESPELNIPESSLDTLIKDLSTEFINLQIKAYHWLTGRTAFKQIKDKVFITTDRFACGFLFENARFLSKENRYIVVYSSRSMLMHMKNRIDELDQEPNILYILDDSMKLPIKEDSIDIFIDDFSSSNFLFFHKAYPIEKLYKYMKVRSLIFGTMFFYKKSSRTIKNIKSEYPHSDIGRISSMLEYKRIIGNMGYEMVESKGPELMRDPGGGDEFPFHEKGDEIICYNYIAKSGEFVF